MSVMTTAFHRAHHGAYGVPSFIGRLLARIAEEVRIHRSMRQLASLDEAMLRDIGLDRGGVEDAVRHGRPSSEGAALPSLRRTGATLPLSLTEWR
jgi:uncharacterized protein YjiS (DUF1127 family)